MADLTNEVMEVVENTDVMQETAEAVLNKPSATQYAAVITVGVAAAYGIWSFGKKYVAPAVVAGVTKIADKVNKKKVVDAEFCEDETESTETESEE